MEESSNGKMEETRKVELPEEVAEVVLKEVEELKLEEVELVTEVVADENSKLSKEAKDENGLVLDKSIGVEEKGLVQEAVGDVAVPLVEEVSEPVEAASVCSYKDSDAVEVGTEEIEEKSLPSLAEPNGVAPVVTDALVDGTEEKRQEREPEPEQPPPPCLHESDGNASEVLSVPRDVEALPDVVSKGIEEDELAVLEEKVGQVSGSVGKGSMEYVEESIKQSDKYTAVGSSDAITPNTGNTPIISLSQRTVQPTSWRSCCGLFEVLRRSNR